MRNFLPRVALVGALLTLAVAAPAWAHVVVSPEEVPAEDYATLTVSVPTEKEVPTTKVRVEVPEGFVLSGVQPFPGGTTPSGRPRPDHGRHLLGWGDTPAGVPAVPHAGPGPEKRASTLGSVPNYEDGSVVEWVGAPIRRSPPRWSRWSRWIRGSWVESGADGS